MYYLQNRWKLSRGRLVYYGIRCGEKLNRNVLKLNGRQEKLLASLPCELTNKQLKILHEAVENRAIAECLPDETPKSLSEAQFCTNCSANNFIIPGLEFTESGLCALCESAEKTAHLKSVVPLVDDIPRSKKSRFDVAVFYTGGKDSTYLLYYLSEIKKLRVLALTWEIPYASDSALRSLENAKKKLDKVEFVTRSVCAEDMRAVYKKLYDLNGNTCACPSLAYVMFYPLLVEEKVPYFFAGNEPAQLIGLFYNRMAPEIAYRFADSKPLNFLVNLGRVLTFRPPLKRGQFHTLTTMKQLAYGTNGFVKRSGYRNELVENVTTAIHTVPHMVEPLKRSVRRSSRSGNIPAFVQVDFDKISGGKYDWTKIKNEICEKCGWVAPEDSGKGLHTSCKIERCKEYSQFIRFYNMQSTMIPFSALEISLASRNGNITREQAIYEIENTMGFSLDEIAECSIMREFFEKE